MENFDIIDALHCGWLNSTTLIRNHRKRKFDRSKLESSFENPTKLQNIFNNLTTDVPVNVLMCRSALSSSLMPLWPSRNLKLSIAKSTPVPDYVQHTDSNGQIPFVYDRQHIRDVIDFFSFQNPVIGHRPIQFNPSFRGGNMLWDISRRFIVPENHIDGFRPVAPALKTLVYDRTYCLSGNCDMFGGVGKTVDLFTEVAMTLSRNIKRQLYDTKTEDEINALAVSLLDCCLNYVISDFLIYRKLFLLQLLRGTWRGSPMQFWKW